MLERREGFLAASDAVVRYIARAYRPNGNDINVSVVAGTRYAPQSPTLRRPVDAFVDVIATQLGIRHNPSNNIIAWQRSPPNYELFATIRVPRHLPGQVRVTVERIPAFRDLLNGRIVFVGASMVDRDQHRTPLSVVEDPTVPGVIIHAQALAQRMDGNRDIIVWSWYKLLLLVAGVAFTCFVVAENHRIDPQGLLYGLFGLLAIGILSFISFKYFRFDIPSIALASAWAFGGFSGFCFGWLYRRWGWR